MCGIAGIVHHKHDEPCSEQNLIAMRDIIRHRGPDDKGIYINKGVGLVHRRLSIIDISSGHQPMQTVDKRFCLVFNGEIYNYQELRVELEKSGYKFNTDSDTEVILNMYLEYGSDCANKLNGIFAFAIWDNDERSLYIARDHMGVKPLYYHLNRGGLTFSSEIKAIFESGNIKPECNIDAVPELFMFRHVAGSRSLFKGISSLLPGHFMVFKDGKIDIQNYWNPLVGNTVFQCSFDEAKHELEKLLIDSVSMQMMSDVPLGTFCSGGVDSSLVTAIAAQNSSQKINTFSVGFNEAEYDESKYARMVSERYQTNHHELILDDKIFSQNLPDMVYSNDEPLNFANSVMIYALSKLAKETVTVVLTGEGADELFGGYPRYKIPTLVDKIQKLPGLLKWLFKVSSSISSDRRLEKLRRYLDIPLHDTVLYNTSTIEQKIFNSYWSSEESRKFDYRTQILEKIGNEKGLLREVSMLDQYTFLVSILNRQDKMSMAASLESRVPILDFRLVEFANSLPENFKQKGTQTKRILKSLAEKYIPKEVIYRRKSGFGVPLSEWFRSKNGLGELAADTFSQVRLSEVSEKLDMNSILEQHLSRKYNHTEILWTTLNYCLWKKAFNIN